MQSAGYGDTILRPPKERNSIFEHAKDDDEHDEPSQYTSGKLFAMRYYFQSNLCSNLLWRTRYAFQNPSNSVATIRLYLLRLSR